MVVVALVDASLIGAASRSGGRAGGSALLLIVGVRFVDDDGGGCVALLVVLVVALFAVTASTVPLEVEAWQVLFGAFGALRGAVSALVVRFGVAVRAPGVPVRAGLPSGARSALKISARGCPGLGRRAECTPLAVARSGSLGLSFYSMRSRGLALGGSVRSFAFYLARGAFASTFSFAPLGSHRGSVVRRHRMPRIAMRDGAVDLSLVRCSPAAYDAITGASQQVCVAPVWVRWWETLVPLEVVPEGIVLLDLLVEQGLEGRVVRALLNAC